MDALNKCYIIEKLPLVVVYIIDCHVIEIKFEGQITTNLEFSTLFEPIVLRTDIFYCIELL